MHRRILFVDDEIQILKSLQEPLLIQIIRYLRQIAVLMHYPFSGTRKLTWLLVI